MSGTHRSWVRSYLYSSTVLKCISFVLLLSIAILLLWNVSKTSTPSACSCIFNVPSPIPMTVETSTKVDERDYGIFVAGDISPTDPHVLQYLHKNHLHPPPPHFRLEAKNKQGHAPTSKIERLLNASNGGFFIECGANDGVFFARTLVLEEKFGWTGLLIEPSPSLFEKLLVRGRNAWTANVCLSGKIEKNEFKMNFDKAHDWMQGTGVINPSNKYDAPLYKPYGLEISKFTSEGIINCFPIISLLTAINQKTIDFFTLDTQGHEYKILKAIPFQELDIKVFLIEYTIAPEGKDAIRELMVRNGYKVAEDDGNDFIFVKA